MLKKLIIIFFCLTAITTAQRKILLISPNNEGGYNIHNLSGEILLEFTKINTDSASLSTMEQIYLDAAQSRVEIPDGYLLVGTVLFGFIFGFFTRNLINKRKF